MRIPVSVLYLYVTILISSCVYSDNEYYLTEIDPGDPPDLEVYINLDTIDSPSVQDSLEVFYDAEVTGGEFIYTRFLIDDLPVFGSDSVPESFMLLADMVENAAYYTVTMEVYYSSNSGSLADILGIEAIREEFTFMIWFDGNQ